MVCVAYKHVIKQHKSECAYAVTCALNKRHQVSCSKSAAISRKTALYSTALQQLTVRVEMYNVGEKNCRALYYSHEWVLFDHVSYTVEVIITMKAALHRNTVLLSPHKVAYKNA